MSKSSKLLDVKAHHDDVVNRLYEGLSEVFRTDTAHTVLSRVKWQPLEDFPEIVCTIDIVIADADSAVHVEGGHSKLALDAGVSTIIEVITPDDYEEEFYERPDTLVLSSAFEYCLFDPTAEVLRPSFQAYRKSETGWQILRTSKDGVFFSHCRFRIDVTGNAIAVSRCRSPLYEEDLYDCRKQFDRVSSGAEGDRGERAAIRAKIDQLEKQAAQQHPGRRK